MGSAHARYDAYQSAVHSTGINAALNIWLPMPFREHAKITLSNEGASDVTLFYQVDYTTGDRHPDDLVLTLATVLVLSPTLPAGFGTVVFLKVEVQ